MDANVSTKLESEETSEELKSSETQASKKRKMVEKTVVRVRIGEGNNISRLKNEGLPSDFWSWRKYGQKPIKGSPYPRCSTSKGCSAKKQVERCRTDASMIIITYTSTHNHPSPDAIISTQNLSQKPKEQEGGETTEEELSKVEEQEQEHEHEHEHEQVEEEHSTDHEKPSTTTVSMATADEKSFHYLQSPISSHEDIVVVDQEDPFKLSSEKSHERIDLLLEEEEPLCYAQIKNLTTKKSDELDFFDELEELPMSSPFLHFTRSILSDERIPVFPS
ncbi:uncharacterized protein [Arachis hypogaea]|uniref:uncharacterized protein isoform X2 n=1 Tax=Arachis hypogaea TaxID=3818 RepID=UPI0010FC63A7|nr:probable WRKY transcription factor 35 isoform X2 [Arachis hypogaea]